MGFEFHRCYARAFHFPADKPFTKPLQFICLRAGLTGQITATVTAELRGLASHASFLIRLPKLLWSVGLELGPAAVWVQLGRWKPGWGEHWLRSWWPDAELMLMLMLPPSAELIPHVQSLFLLSSPFSGLNNIPSCIHTTSSSSVHHQWTLTLCLYLGYCELWLQWKNGCRYLFRI